MCMKNVEEYYKLNNCLLVFYNIQNILADKIKINVCSHSNPHRYTYEIKEQVGRSSYRD